MTPELNTSATAAPVFHPGPALREAEIRRTWGLVGVGEVSVRQLEEASPLQVIRASICLGPLLPLDVIVELWCEATDVVTEAPLVRRRMWSDHPRGNGSFVFEVRLPEENLGGVERLRVRVRPVHPFLRATPGVDIVELGMSLGAARLERAV